MARNRCTLPIVLTVALSLGVLAPAAAARITFTAAQPAILEGERSGPDVFTAGGIAKECPEVRFDGSLRGSSPTLRLEPIYGRPVYSGCTAKALGGLRAKFAWRACSYLLHPTGKIDGEERWRADVDIECPNRSGIQWYLYANQADFKEGYGSCATVMRSQTGLGTAELSNVGGSPGEIAIHWNLTGIEYRAYGSSLLCGPLFEPRRDASYRGDATIAARDHRGQRVDLAVSD